MTEPTYTEPTWVDVPEGTTPPPDAVPISAANLTAYVTHAIKQAIDRAVASLRYDAAQALTPAQQAVLRANQALGDIATRDAADFAALDGGGKISAGVVPDISDVYRSVQALPAFFGLNRALADGTRSVAIQTLSDSTGVSTDRWPYRLGAMLAAKHPTWNVQQYDWDDASQDYLAATIIQTAAAGARYLDCSTGTTTRLLDPSVSAHLTGVIDVRMKVSFTSWPPASQFNLCGRSGGAGQRGWYIYMSTAGLPGFAYSTDGSTVSVITGGGGTFAITPNSVFWLRYVFTPDDGAGNHTFAAYSSLDGVTWTQVGVTTTTAGTVALFDSGRGFEVGGVASGIGNAAMRVYEIQIRDGLNGPNKVPAMPDNWPPYNASSAVAAGAPTLTIVNGARSGGTIAYLTDPTRLAKLSPNYGQAVIFLSSSHNEGTHFGREYLATLDTFRTSALGLFGGGIPIVALTQNPEVSGVSSGWTKEHAKRRLDLIAYGRAQSIDVIDTYGQFLADANWATDYMNADGTHPNSAGSALWAQTIMNAIDVSVLA